ncbi:hypothetical protein KKJ06_18655 [Xenorhabdus bovienii]|uniref:hypothetical protein n=1 Tax=Xenorhabdus bovienii TaxID=40576 RepID=UPI0023B32D30|nr:hypothetical protein [Xenorhabdus bovienii]MDE9455348.1 hypothetical protein [Xenorhabdus bovienii]MDE9544651.1 hypothetical protein [Xenorhabdus bovienii]MDE9557385.1 hypothetical protein [Xenorhabdus bovienii]MDE9565527.1 hypothetical protein [Xenorhabdus bovienii]
MDSTAMSLSYYFFFLYGKGLVKPYTMANGGESIQIEFKDFNHLKHSSLRQEPDECTRTRLTSMGFIPSSNIRYILNDKYFNEISIITYHSIILPNLIYETDENEVERRLRLATNFIGGTPSPKAKNGQQAPTPEYYQAAMSGIAPCSSNLPPPIAPLYAPDRNIRRQLATRHLPSRHVPSHGSAPSSYASPPPAYGSPPVYGSPDPYKAPPSYESIAQNPMGSRGGIPGPSNLPSTSGRGSASLPRGRKRGRK